MAQYESTAAPFHVSIWDERDRLHISLNDRDDETVAEWWDDEARDMFDDGFFVQGRVQQSVIEYAIENSIIPPRKEWAKYEEEYDDEEDDEEDE